MERPIENSFLGWLDSLYRRMNRLLILTSNKNIYHRIKCPRNHPLGGLMSCPHSDSVFRFCFKLIWVFSSPILPELQIQFDVEIGKLIKMKKRASDIADVVKEDIIFVQTVVLLGTVAGNGQDLLNCLQDSSGAGCSGNVLMNWTLRFESIMDHDSWFSRFWFLKLCKVNTIDSSAGLIETPHPYESNTLYMFEVPSPSASQSFTFQFTEFEVSKGILSFIKIKIWNIIFNVLIHKNNL